MDVRFILNRGPSIKVTCGQMTKISSGENFNALRLILAWHISQLCKYYCPVGCANSELFTSVV